jgi:hypothetical protein
MKEQLTTRAMAVYLLTVQWSTANDAPAAKWNKTSRLIHTSCAW